MTETGSWRVIVAPKRPRYTRASRRTADAPVNATPTSYPQGKLAMVAYSTKAQRMLSAVNALREHKVAKRPEAGIGGIAGGPRDQRRVEGGLRAAMIDRARETGPPAAERVVRFIRSALARRRATLLLREWPDAFERTSP